MQPVEPYEVCKLELKYCELCGKLWFRMKASATAHCLACKKRLVELATPPAFGSCRTRRRP